jgi:hypothetical protein
MVFVSLRVAEYTLYPPATGAIQSTPGGHTLQRVAEAALSPKQAVVIDQPQAWALWTLCVILRSGDRVLVLDVRTQCGMRFRLSLPVKTRR